MLKIKVAVSFPVDLTGVVMAGADGFKADMLDIRHAAVVVMPVVVFMLIVLASFAGMRTGTIPLTLILVLILYLGSEIFQAVTGTAGLAQLTHIAGGVLGMIFGFTWSRGKRGAR